MRTMTKHRATLHVAFASLILVGTTLLWGCAAPATPTPLATPTVAAAATSTAVAGAAATPVATTGPSTAAPTTASGQQPGQQAMVMFNCGSCHTIPGVQGANGTSAPSLAGYGSMPQILGQVPNTAQNTAAFIQNPQQVVPGATMPNLNVPAPAAQNMAAYLETLK